LIKEEKHMKNFKLGIALIAFLFLIFKVNATQYSIVFDNYSYFYASAPSFSNVLNGYSIVFWFKTTTPSGIMFDNQLVNTTGYNAGNTAYDKFFGWYAGNLTFGVWNGSEVYISSSSSYADGKWHFASGVVNASGGYLFVDGVLVGQNTGVNSSNAQNVSGYVMVGGGAQQGGSSEQWGFAGPEFNNTFLGSVTNVQIYNTALTFKQISNLYSNGIASQALSTVAGWWLAPGSSLNDLNFGTVDDESGNGNNGFIATVNTQPFNTSIIQSIP